MFKVKNLSSTEPLTFSVDRKGGIRSKRNYKRSDAENAKAQSSMIKRSKQQSKLPGRIYDDIDVWLIFLEDNTADLVSRDVFCSIGSARRDVFG